MTPEERNAFLEAMERWVDQYDCEIAHEEADKILCDALVKLGHQDLVEKFKKVCKWYA